MEAKNKENSSQGIYSRLFVMKYTGNEITITIIFTISEVHFKAS